MSRTQLCFHRPWHYRKIAQYISWTYSINYIGEMQRSATWNRANHNLFSKITGEMPMKQRRRPCKNQFEVKSINLKLVKCSHSFHIHKHTHKTGICWLVIFIYSWVLYSTPFPQSHTNERVVNSVQTFDETKTGKVIIGKFPLFTMRKCFCFGFIGVRAEHVKSIVKS